MSSLGQSIKRVEMAEERLKTQQSVVDTNNGGGSFNLKKSATLKGDLQIMNDRTRN
jgi:hypothetical protein